AVEFVVDPPDATVSEGGKTLGAASSFTAGSPLQLRGPQVHDLLLSAPGPKPKPERILVAGNAGRDRTDVTEKLMGDEVAPPGCPSRPGARTAPPTVRGTPSRSSVLRRARAPPRTRRRRRRSTAGPSETRRGGTRRRPSPRRPSSGPAASGCG